MRQIKNQVLFLEDKTRTGKERPWKLHKESSMSLSNIYNEFNEKKAVRVGNCSDYLQFKLLDDAKLNLHQAYFCKVRMCPMCSWRRSLKCFSNMSRILESMETKEKNSFKYLFLTLTVKNCSSKELNNTLDDIMKSWHLFAKYKKIKDNIKGYYRALEVTHDVNPFITKEMMKRSFNFYRKQGLVLGDVNPNYDMYHPHFHVIMAVDFDYFTNKDKYISKSNFTDIWKNSLKVNYNPIVDVRKICSNSKSNLIKAISEASKYSVKSNDYIISDDFDFSVKTVQLLDKVLNNRRFIAYGGKFKEWHKKLNLEDEQDGNLINIDEEKELNEQFTLITYFWNTGYRNYCI